MTTQEARQVFDTIAAKHRAAGNHDQAARVEIVREYFTNPSFKQALADHVWAINQRRS